MDPAYRSHLAARGLRPATIRAYTQWVDRLSPHPDTLTCEDIEAWIAAHPRYATRAYAVSHDIEAVRVLMGHSSTTTTQMYVAVADEQLRAAARGGWAA